MFEYLFPIFAFGLVVTGIVFKGVLAAADVAKADRLAKERSRATRFETPADVPASVQTVMKPAAA